MPNPGILLPGLIFHGMYFSPPGGDVLFFSPVGMLRTVSSCIRHAVTAVVRLALRSAAPTRHGLRWFGFLAVAEHAPRHRKEQKKPMGLRENVVSFQVAKTRCIKTTVKMKPFKMSGNAFGSSELCNRQDATLGHSQRTSTVGRCTMVYALPGPHLHSFTAHIS